jgi:ankyrin repeat protein
VSNDEGDTALMWDCANGRKDAIQMLLASGANANASNDKGETALMWASIDGHKDVYRCCSPAASTSTRAVSCLVFPYS